MSLLDIIMKRHSVRNFKNNPVEVEQILKVLEAVRNAPSAVNFQPYHFIVVTNEDVKDKLHQAYPRDWLKAAPVIIVACGDHTTSWKRKDGKDHCDIDVAIAVDHMTLAATELGLGTCWICAFDAKLCHELLALPENLEVIALVPIGHPDEQTEPEKKRKSIEEMVSWESYGKL